MGGDIVYIVSKNAFFAGPNNVAYGAAKADQAHQVRLLAAELGEHGIRVNGVNPDGVVRGSGIFAKRLGRRAGADLRHRRGQAGRVLRPADAAQARGPAGARGGRRVRARRRRPRPDDRAAHPGRRRGCGRVPALRSVGALSRPEQPQDDERVPRARPRTWRSRVGAVPRGSPGSRPPGSPRSRGPHRRSGAPRADGRRPRAGRGLLPPSRRARASVRVRPSSSSRPVERSGRRASRPPRRPPRQPAR